MQFSKVLELNYQHHYFTNIDAPGLLSIVPLAQTQTLLANLQMQFKTTPSGFFVYSQTVSKGKATEYFIPPPAATHCSFAIYSTNPWLANFTDLPDIRPGEQVFYDYFAADFTTDQNTASLQPYPLQQKRLLVNKYSFTVTKVNSLVCNLSTVTSEQGGEGNAEFPDQSRCYLDMTGWPDGLYCVRDINTGSIEDDFYRTKYFASRELIAKPPLAILEYGLPEQIPSSLVASVLTLKARAVYWQYQINGSEQGDILSVNTSIATKANAQQSGMSPSIFSEVANDSSLSSSQIQLTQAPWTGIALQDQTTKSTLVANLPNPAPDQIYQFKKSQTIASVKVKKGDYYASIKVEL